MSDFVHGVGIFSKYGKSFQEKILAGLINDKNYAAQMFEVMKSNFFDVKYLEFLCENYFLYYQTYKTFPELGILVTIIKDKLVAGNDIILRDQIIEYLHRIKSNQNLSDLPYVKDKSLDFCKRQSMKNALEKAVSLIEDEKFESVVSLMKEASALGIPHTTGHDFFDEIDARFVLNNRCCVPTGLKLIDDKQILDGGLGKGELGVIVAPTGCGKSHFLVSLGVAAMKAGKNVLHYTFELSEHIVGLRYDSNICDISASEIREKKEDVKKTYEETGKNLGKLIIKEYPTGSASILTLKNHIEKLSLKGFHPNLLLIDYADIMRSSRASESLRHELKYVYEELRNLAGELACPIWTASQAGRDAANSDIVGLENMSESYGKAQVADVVLSLSRKPEEKSTGQARMFVAKNRAGRDGIVFPIIIDTSRSKFNFYSEENFTLHEAKQQNDSEVKDRVRKKWKELKNDLLFES